jgi:hypothetical protein
MEYFPEGKSDQHVGLTSLPPSHAKLSGNLGVSTSRNPEGLSSPVHGLLNVHLSALSTEGAYVCYDPQNKQQLFPTRDQVPGLYNGASLLSELHAKLLNIIVINISSKVLQKEQ